MLTMCVELSCDASIQFRIESRSVIPCGVGLLKILSILELGVTKILLKSSHVKRMRSNDAQKPGDNAMKKGPDDKNRNCESTRLKWANSNQSQIGNCHQILHGHCCRHMFDIPTPRTHTPDPKRLSRGVGVLGVALVCPQAFVSNAYQSLVVLTVIGRSLKGQTPTICVYSDFFDCLSEAQSRGTERDVLPKKQSGKKSDTFVPQRHEG
jgi:hypothetical protein